MRFVVKKEEVEKPMVVELEQAKSCGGKNVVVRLNGQIVATFDSSSQSLWLRQSNLKEQGVAVING